jgi:hypothetical protein
MEVANKRTVYPKPTRLYRYNDARESESVTGHRQDARDRPPVNQWVRPAESVREFLLNACSQSQETGTPCPTGGTEKPHGESGSQTRLGVNYRHNWG